MTITQLPDPPSRADPSNFSARTDVFLAALPTLVDEINAGTPGESAFALAQNLSSSAVGKGSKLVAWIRRATGAVATWVETVLSWREIDVREFGATMDGTTDDYAAVLAAIAALPSTGGTIVIPDSVTGMKLGTTVAPTKPVRFKIGHLTIRGPAVGFIFDLPNNGSSLVPAGRGATIFKLTTPTSAPVMPVVTVTLTAGVVTSATIVSAGSGLYTTPLTLVSASPTTDDAALIATVAGGVLTGVAIVAGGSGYVSAPTISFIGGGAGAIKSNEILGGTLSDFSVDMSSIPNATGVYVYGGWYFNHHDIDIIATASHATAIDYLIDSHTLGIPGPTGSFGGAYVNHISNMYAKKFAVIGHDTSTATATQIDTLDATAVYIHGGVGFTFVNPVVQSNSGFMFDLVNVDGVTLFGGDVEGTAGLFKVRGSCNNIRAKGTLAYAMYGPYYYGTLGSGWDIDLAKSNSNIEQVRTGNGGTAGLAIQNVGWNIVHRFGIPYSGDTLVFASNLKLLTATTANLDDISQAGIAILMDGSGQLTVRRAMAGANPRTLVDVAQFDSGGLKMTNLPSANPGAGTKRFWYDAADSNRVKFAP